MMKIFKRSLLLALAFVSSLDPVHGQQIFQNLDFERPVLPLVPVDDFWVSSDKAIPGWIPYLNGIAQSQIVYNTVSFGAAAISLHDNQSFHKPIEGNYSIFMQSSSGGPSTSIGLGQYGTIPLDTRSLRFYATGPIEVTFAGSLIPLMCLDYGNDSYPPLLAGDLTSYAGEYGELRFTILNEFVSSPLDDIQFSSEAVPEPSMLALLGLGGFALIWRCKGSRT